MSTEKDLRDLHRELARTRTPEAAAAAVARLEQLPLERVQRALGLKSGGGQRVASRPARARRAMRPSPRELHELGRCVRGHELTEENTIRRANGTRTCRECHRERVRRNEPRRAKPARCCRGHVLSAENVRVNARGQRRCQECVRTRVRRPRACRWRNTGRGNSRCRCPRAHEVAHG